MRTSVYEDYENISIKLHNKSFFKQRLLKLKFNYLLNKYYFSNILTFLEKNYI